MRVRQRLMLVYRIPSEPASKRVAIWRDLKRTGALYLQQCVCILPGRTCVTYGTRKKLAAGALSKRSKKDQHESQVSCTELRA